MFGRLSSSPQGEKKEKEETHAAIFANLKTEVKAIKETERESMEGVSLIAQEWGGKGELAFIINLVPM
tara:strand:- start:193 stop:396 length:204 start_codon:yes stop_codon:yes gene_type:complete